MILCLDCGNTRLKWGLRDGDKWAAGGVLPHAEIAGVGNLFDADFTPRAVVGCNVAGMERGIQIEAALGLPIRWVTAMPQQCGVINRYDSPQTLGADRWAALIGAHALHRGAALVVLAGTATTVDVLLADGRFEGGLILPGLNMMADTLASSTAQLPRTDGGYRLLPRNTHDAITSGAIHATLGAIGRMFATLPADQAATCLLAGGAADVLLPHLELPARRIDSLVLEGLVRIAAELRAYHA